MSEPEELFLRRAVAVMQHCDRWDEEQELCRFPRTCVCLRLARGEIAKLLKWVQGLKSLTKRNKK